MSQEIAALANMQQLELVPEEISDFALKMIPLLKMQSSEMMLKIIQTETKILDLVLEGLSM